MIFISIKFIFTSKNPSGGNIYENFFSEYLKNNFKKYTSENVYAGKNIFRFFNKTRNVKSKPNDLIIRPLGACFFLKKDVKNIIIIHHIDWKYSKFYVKIMQTLQYLSFLLSRKKIDRIIVVSKYWQIFLQKKGFKNINVIYNPFSINDFNFSPKEIENFKKKNKLNSTKPIIYVGNPQKKKGITDILKHIDKDRFQLVASGLSDAKYKDVKQLFLSYREYLLLLKSSDVVLTMSKFKEGWCRTAHEALLCKTPVIGSGSGGMGELLKGARQYILKDLSKLNLLIEQVLKNKEQIGEIGFQYAKKFTTEKFENSINLLFENQHQ